MRRILRFWQTLSELGTTSLLANTARKHIILSNQISVLMIFLALVGFMTNLLIGRFYINLSVGILGVFFVLILLLNRANQTLLSRMLFGICPPIIYLFPIVLSKHADAGNFLSSPFFLLIFLVIPLSLIDYKKEKNYWLIAIVFSLILNLFFDKFIINVIDNRPDISFLTDNYTLYRLPHLFLWVSIVLGFIFLKNINLYYEKRLEVSNIELIRKNNQLGVTEAELRQNIEELQTTKELLANQNEELNRLYKKLKSDERFLLKEYKRVKDRDVQINHKNHELESKNHELNVTLEKLKQAQAQLVQSEKMVSLGILTAGIAHEINNPINFINAGVTGLKRSVSKIVELLEEYQKLTPENYQEQNKHIEQLKSKYRFSLMLETTLKVVDNIGTGAYRTTEIVKELRTFSRLDEAELKTVNIHDGIDSVLVLLRNQYKDRIEIVKKYAEIPLIECYPGKLNQVFMNILSNAIQAIEKEGEIVITTQLLEEQIQISFQDSGSGIPKNIQNKIFEPFFTTKSVGKGTGLGLSITISIIQQDHQGKIEVISEEGQGTTFNIKLPISQKRKTILPISTDKNPLLGSGL